VQAPDALVEIDRMTPYDPTGAGRTLDAPDTRIDDRAVAADGTFPGLQPTLAKTHGGQLPVRITPGEAVAVTLHDHYAETAEDGSAAGARSKRNGAGPARERLVRAR
jgi:hypothetical protein